MAKFRTRRGGGDGMKSSIKGKLYRRQEPNWTPDVNKLADEVADENFPEVTEKSI